MEHIDFEIFLVATPGLERVLVDEARAAGFQGATPCPGGVTFRGSWPDVWRANLTLRGATRVLARIGEFRAFHLAQLDKRARKFPWGDTLRPDLPVRVEVTTNRKSKIYHAGAATQRIETALREAHGIQIDKAAAITVKCRIDDNLCTFSLDTSGESLHKRGHKEAVGKAPMRETLASLFLRDCGFTGDEPVLDPMCGSGTFVIEAAEIAAGLLPGRSRGFAFQQLANFDADAWEALRQAPPTQTPENRFYGSDRNTGAIDMATKNAARAGVGEFCTFHHSAVADIAPPDGPPGLVMVNPPYGARIGNRNLLFALYGTLGKVLQERFSGWRVGIVTSDAGLAKATKLPFLPLGASVPHGGLSVRLYKTGPLR
ncbi:class I SAM-dependent RNA methyltransferase [Aliiroseovarius subalbicans]|uniref:THUMP domain-containing class I SAM-dependent RNA methyltransferase n=1 Tax=Aliiroseovarius subalbicans TaxID=2925840 RepID=UPI001F5844F0|nr:class I SAM-dependent RNA methyltransferase [Aliiroseovarius subalbicans]MCI2400636.1 class I SAM-dependent RNA methyltransferase [Aliiroseovarius subalbicans]